MEGNSVQRQKTRTGGKGWGATFQRTLASNFYARLFIFLGVQALCCYFNHIALVWWTMGSSAFDLRPESKSVLCSEMPLQPVNAQWSQSYSLTQRTGHINCTGWGILCSSLSSFAKSFASLFLKIFFLHSLHVFIGVLYKSCVVKSATPIIQGKFLPNTLHIPDWISPYDSAKYACIHVWEVVGVCHHASGYRC